MMICDWCQGEGYQLTEYQAKCKDCHHEWQTKMEWDWSMVEDIIQRIKGEEE